jgi:RNA polymerase sigma factor (sigma-70 family)
MASDLNAAIDSLPPQFRTVVILHYGYDLPTEEIAQLLRRPSGTVRYWLVQARAQLHQHSRLREVDS